MNGSSPTPFTDTILGNILSPDPDRPYCGYTFFEAGPHRCVLKPDHPSPGVLHDCGETCPTCLRRPDIARELGKTP